MGRYGRGAAASCLVRLKRPQDLLVRWLLPIRCLLPRRFVSTQQLEPPAMLQPRNRSYDVVIGLVQGDRAHAEWVALCSQLPHRLFLLDAPVT